MDPARRARYQDSLPAGVVPGGVGDSESGSLGRGVWAEKAAGLPFKTWSHFETLPKLGFLFLRFCFLELGCVRPHNLRMFRAKCSRKSSINALCSL